MYRFERLSITCLLVAISLLGAPLTTWAEPPPVIGYQAYLTDRDGLPIDGGRHIRFSLFPSAQGAAALWTEAHEVEVAAGLLSVQLGSRTPITGVDLRVTPFLEVQVESEPADDAAPASRLGALCTGGGQHDWDAADPDAELIS